MLEEILLKTMDKPQLFGLYHIIWLAIILFITIVMALYMRNASLKKYKRVILIIWIIVFSLEIIKELLLAYISSWSYSWSAFPFQLCSMILYVIPLILVSSPNRGKLSKFIFDSSIAFTSTYLFFGGLITLINAETIFGTLVFINTQTMIHHGAQVVLGVITMVCFRKELDFKMIFRGLVLFLVLVGIATIMNETFILFLPEGTYFNMFYISRYFDPPQLAAILYSKVGYPIYLILYIVGFSLSAFLVYGVLKLIKRAHL